MADDNLIKIAQALETKADEALSRGLDFCDIAGGDPSAALSDFERAGALSAAAQLARKRAKDA